jgi:hypothetical protein
MRGDMQASGENKRALLAELWRDRMHTDPQALDLASAAVRAVLGSIWEPAERMRARLADLPEGMLALWRSTGRGHLVFGHLASRYVPGAQIWREQGMEGVCYLSVADIAGDPRAALVVVGDLIDHLLGSGALSGGAWFADGEVIVPALREIAAQFGRLHTLAYATPSGAVETPRAYFARTWALYMTDPVGLNTLDPLAYRLYRHTLMSGAWWGRFSSRTHST